VSRRWVFNFASVMSLMLCLAVVLLWIRSVETKESAGYSTWLTSRNEYVQYEISSEHGSVDIVIEHESGFRSIPIPPAELGWEFQSSAAESRQSTTVWERMGFWHIRTGFFDLGIASTTTADMVPQFLLIAVLLVPPLYWVRRRLRSNRAQGHCPTCGYNLTANTSGICPECGTAISRQPEGAA
jgi:hypothetical protein